MSAPRPLNTKQAADYLGCAPNTLKQWRCMRKGPAYHKVGNLCTYDIPDLEAHKRAHRVVPEGAN